MKKLITLMSLVLCLVSGSLFAEQIKIIDTAKDAFQIRMDLAKNAKDEILMSYFIFAEDSTSYDLLALLKEKAKQGVKVKILVDQMFNAIPKYLGTHLVSEGVEIRNFNKFGVHKLLHSVKYRMHDKMFLVDGNIAGEEHLLLGGRNIEDTYYDLAEKNYHDRDIYIKGELAIEARTYWYSLWNAKHVTNFKLKKRLHKKKRKAKLQHEINELDDHYNKLSSHKYLSEEVVRTWGQDMIEVENTNIVFAHDLVSYRKKKRSGTSKALYALIENAKKEVIIDSPYFVVTRILKKILKKKLAEGVKIRVLTNSLYATDGLFPQAAYLNQRRKLARMGIELYEYYNKNCFHSKSMVVDGKIAVIGSFNFDPRSEDLNTETAAIVENVEIAGLLRASMDETLKSSYRLDRKGKPIGHDSRLPGSKLGKKIITRIIQILVAPWAKGFL